MQEHLLTFEQQWTDEASGHSLPKFVTDELHGFMSCGILGRGFAHLAATPATNTMLWPFRARRAQCARAALAGA
jgi:hypothetical protein